METLHLSRFVELFPEIILKVFSVALSAYDPEIQAEFSHQIQGFFQLFSDTFHLLSFEN